MPIRFSKFSSKKKDLVRGQGWLFFGYVIVLCQL